MSNEVAEIRRRWSCEDSIPALVDNSEQSKLIAQATRDILVLLKLITQLEEDNEHLHQQMTWEIYD